MLRHLDILVADHHPIFAEGIRSLLSNSKEGEFSFHIKGVAVNGSQVEEYLDNSQPDLFLLDPDLPDAEGLKIVASVKQSGPKTRVLILNGSVDPLQIQAAFRAGADGYMLKSGTHEELLKAVGELAEGRTYVGRGLMPFATQQEADGLSPEVRFARQYQLTKREIEILKLIGQALTNKEIADRIFISDQTASVHRKNIMRKLGVNSTGALIKLAFENHLV
ncbi:MAG TPA: response regulator transcription factor [Saprospiraceae bacterium]|nr:response regulator transcription factor [Saprospiraceae bacterium]